jgi:hypothetical protein
MKMKKFMHKNNKHYKFMRNVSFCSATLLCSVVFILAKAEYKNSSRGMILLGKLNKFTENGIEFTVDHFYRENYNSNSYNIHPITTIIGNKKTLVTINAGGYNEYGNTLSKSNFFYTGADLTEDGMIEYYGCLDLRRDSFFLKKKDGSYIYHFEKTDDFDFIVYEYKMVFDDSGTPGTSPIEFNFIRQKLIKMDDLEKCNLYNVMNAATEFSQQGR